MPHPPLQVEPLLSGPDNIIWLIHTEPNTFVAVDPTEADRVTHFLTQRQSKLSHILITHHHQDHAGGVTTLQQRHGAQVIGAQADRARLPPLDQAVAQDDQILLAAGITAQVLEVPGHTTGHLAYWIDDALFSGDTLFGFGCGRLFEGTPKMMWNSLLKLRALPDATRLFAGHEYTLANLAFVCDLEPENQELNKLYKKLQAHTQNGALTLPHPLVLEKRFNPFLRADDPNYINRIKINGTSPVEIFAALREQRNHY